MRQERGGTRPLYSIIADNIDEPDFIWLPNAIVTGAAKETPPLEILRKTGRRDVVRLFVALYAAQNLAEDYGVPRDQIWLPFSKERMGEHGAFIILGFDRGAMTAKPGPLTKPHLTGEKQQMPDGQLRDPGWDTFWSALECLTGSGLAHFVAHVVDGEGDLSDVAHPLPVDNNALDAERAIALAAEQAVESMLGSGRMAATNSYDAVLPVERHRTTVELVGILRMKYLPKTKLNSAWIAREEEWTAVAEGFTTMSNAVESGFPAAPFHVPKSVV